MYSEVLIVKYGGSRMNDAHTISPANFVGLPAKIIWLTTFFLKKKATFALAAGRLTWESAPGLCLILLHLD